MAAVYPDIHQKNCLNMLIPDIGEATCTHCRDICPADAISLGELHLPRLNEKRCTDCTACVHICPSDAITHGKVDPVGIVDLADELARRGKKRLRATCSAVSAKSTDLRVPCHAIWDPMLLACMAAEGIQTLHMAGISQCNSCPVHHGAEIMARTEKDYALLNQALGVHLKILRQETTIPTEQTRRSVPEPARRAFFRNLIPSVAQGASIAAAQIGQAASQAMRQEVHDKGASPSSLLPVRLRLFLLALPRLQANFTPIPSIPGLPLGAIQADAGCTACNQCVEQCPTLALSIREFGANKVLEFQPDACIGCRHCIALCPDNALESLPGISLPALLTRRARPLVMVSSGTFGEFRSAPNMESQGKD